MNDSMTELLPRPLFDLCPVLAQIPSEHHHWIATRHLEYLDNRIHQIDRLTDYLANCSQVETERSALMTFVLDWTRRPNADLIQYVREYATRFRNVRTQVEALCDDYLATRMNTPLNHSFVAFWRAFSRINEIDSVYGMFLTSGRWYVNAMLPAVKELVYCFLQGRSEVPAAAADAMAYRVARRIITPCHAEQALESDRIYETAFATRFMPILQFFDRKLCFLFELLREIPSSECHSFDVLVASTREQKPAIARLLAQGIYAPFAWHELQASRKPRRPLRPLEECCQPLFAAIPAEHATRAKVALDCLTVLKEYELNYNNYNYKGRFGLISKFQYLHTANLLPLEAREPFISAILLDRFYDALAIIESQPIK